MVVAKLSERLPTTRLEQDLNPIIVFLIEHLFYVNSMAIEKRPVMTGLITKNRQKCQIEI